MEPIHIDAPASVLVNQPAHVDAQTTDVIIIGGGVTGLMAALRASRSAHVVLLTQDTPLESNSAWAQGGIAAALDAADSPLSHVEDTLVAGAGLSDSAAVEALAWEAPLLMYELADLGVPFERDNGSFVLGLEGSHSHRRILHVGDMTGMAITQTLVNQVRSSPQIHVLEGYKAIDLLNHDGRCDGVLVRDQMGNLLRFQAQATILATGGAGALYGLTSNQAGALGEGIALAYRAGAEVVDMEFVQFHPTVFRTSSGRGFLISEATRGEGGRLFSPDGERFMPALHPRAELAPRDVVTRGIFASMQREDVDHVLLDLTHLSSDYLQRRFPTIYTRCRQEGIDLAVERVPVAPAAHYLMGGIRTDLYGATSIAGLYAAGECACSGVHGANRLASNSLLECLVSGSRAAVAAVQGPGLMENAECRMQNAGQGPGLMENAEWRMQNAGQGLEDDTPQAADRRPHVQVTNERMGEQGANGSAAGNGDLRGVLADIMRCCAGPLRTADELQAGLRRLAAFPLQATMQDGERLTVANAALVARLIMAGALQREESRGAHYRRDFPTSREEWRVHMVLGRGQPAYAVEHVAEGVVHAGPPTLDMQTCPLRLPPRTREHEPVLVQSATA